MEFHQVLAVVTHWEWHFADSWRIPKAGEVTFRLEPGNYPPSDACTALALGETMGGVKLTRQCEMVSVERPKQDWTKDMNDLIDDTQFMLTVQGVGGPKLEGPPRGTGYGGADDAGFSVAVDAKGQVVDFSSSLSADAASRSYLLTVSFPR